MPIDTRQLAGSIALKGGRIDDLALVKYRETVDPKSPPIVLLSPSGSPHPFYAEFGWTDARRRQCQAARRRTRSGRRQGSGALSVGHPVTLTYDNGEGLEFRRTIAVDDKYLFTIKDEVANKSASPVTLFPYALISRHGTPQTLGYYILHEGLIGVLGDQGLQEVTYKKIEDKKSSSTSTSPTPGSASPTNTGRRRCCPTPTRISRRISPPARSAPIKTYQTDYLLDAQTIAPGATGSANARLFAGAKEVARRSTATRSSSISTASIC